MSIENSTSFGLVVRRLREKKGLTLRQFAKETGISASYLARLENGERTSPSLKVAVLLAKHLDMSLESFIDIVETDFAYDEPAVTKLEELLLYYCNVTLNNKVLDLDFKKRLLDLVDIIVSSTDTSELETVIINKTEKLKAAYHSL